MHHRLALELDATARGQHAAELVTADLTPGRCRTGRRGPILPSMPRSAFGLWLSADLGQHITALDAADLGLDVAELGTTRSAGRRCRGVSSGPCLPTAYLTLDGTATPAQAATRR